MSNCGNDGAKACLTEWVTRSPWVPGRILGTEGLCRSVGCMGITKGLTGIFQGDYTWMTGWEFTKRVTGFALGLVCSWNSGNLQSPSWINSAPSVGWSSRCS